MNAIAFFSLLGFIWLAGFCCGVGLTGSWFTRRKP